MCLACASAGLVTGLLIGVEICYNSGREDYFSEEECRTWT